ncbi:hypothetical protein [Rhodobacter calidifons]|uniref:Uncharacterized protein n=1 Tax=Rhodobacter calidifons TaxID=2715277 RepID=A0ABX0G5G6_9RHOB|nr:hypothetical protein [Rhodobacter calidifons]NHB76464.1 hypothetical protein [Rhodobacter calidifons]
MDTDLVLTVGILLLVLSIPSLLSAWAENRAPRMGAIMAITALGMISSALIYSPGGYTFQEVPGVILKTVMRVFG